MMRFNPLWAVLPVVLLSVPSWAGKKAPPDVVEDALAYASSDRAKAIQLLEQALVDGVSPKDVDVVTVHAGEQRRLNGDTAAARDWFRSVSTRTKKGDNHESARLGLALMDAEVELTPALLAVLDDISEKAVLPTQNADRFLMLAVHAASQGDTAAMSKFASSSLEYAKEDEEVHTRIEDRFSRLAELSPEEATQALAPADAGTGPLDKAEAALASGDLERARRFAERAAQSNNPVVAAQGKGLVRSLDGATVNPRKIAVLLPLSGKYATVGRHVQEALEFGYGDQSRSLVLIDSGASAESAVSALEDAVLNQGVIAVVGPLLSDETEAVVQVAETLRVPLLSLSQSYATAAEHDYALQAMHTRADQVHALVEYVMGERGITRFAVFHPESKFGQHAAELFHTEVEARGGEIKTEASYPEGEKNLLTYAKKLGNRTGNIHKLRQEAAAQGGNPGTVVLPPTIDFEALFLPESASRTPLACAALAYEEFPMGEFTPKRNSPVIPLLGLSSWNTVNLVTQGNEYTRNSLFTDVFSSAVSGNEDPFVASFHASTGRTPSALEAATVDAGRLLAAAARSSAQTRPAFRDALLEVKIEDSVTGAWTIDPEHHAATRRMLILTITRETIEKVGEIEIK